MMGLEDAENLTFPFLVTLRRQHLHFQGEEIETAQGWKSGQLALAPWEEVP
jgi:hypothetical protein